MCRSLESKKTEAWIELYTDHYGTQTLDEGGMLHWTGDPTDDATESVRDLQYFISVCSEMKMTEKELYECVTVGELRGVVVPNASDDIESHIVVVTDEGKCHCLETNFQEFRKIKELAFTKALEWAINAGEYNE